MQRGRARVWQRCRVAGVCLGAALSAVLVAFPACKRVSVSLSELPCDNGQCVEGYSCDAVTGTCISQGNGCSDEGRRSPCEWGETTCLKGCRTCENGTWSGCVPPPVSCVPNAVVCDDWGDLVKCDANGNVADMQACAHGCNSTTASPQCNVCTPDATTCDGTSSLVECDTTGLHTTATSCPSGCNVEAIPQRCNDCAPDSTRCDNMSWIECGSDGLVIHTEDCPTTIACTGASTCDDNEGCVIQPTAPDGTPCDEGDGHDDNLCNSQCESGVCVQAMSRTCDDNNPCTVDSCVPATGICSNLAGYPGTECRPAVGGCDVAETCNGSSSSCPPDGYADGSVVCRIAAGRCDVDETCTGSGVACPNDAFLPDTEVCRSAVNACDVAEHCTGSSAACPDDGFADSGTPCNSSDTTQCTSPDTCDGSGFCDPNNIKDGTSCTGGLCQEGKCIPVAAVTVSLTPQGCATLTPNVNGQTLVGVDIEATNAASTLTSITFRKHASSSTAASGFAASSIKLYRDNDADGVLDVSGDTQLGSATSFGSVMTFGSLTLALSVGTKVHLILVGDVAASANNTYFAIRMASVDDFVIPAGDQKVLNPSPLIGSAHAISDLSCPNNLGFVAGSARITAVASITGKNDGWATDPDGTANCTSETCYPETNSPGIQKNSPGDCDLDDDKYPDQLYLSDNGNSSNYLHINTGVPLGLPICGLTLRLNATDSDAAAYGGDKACSTGSSGGGWHTGLFGDNYGGACSGTCTGLDTHYLYWYSSAPNNTSGSVSTASAINGVTPTTTNGSRSRDTCYTQYVSHNIKALYDAATAAGMSTTDQTLHVRFVGDTGDGLGTSSGVYVNSVSEIYVDIRP